MPSHKTPPRGYRLMDYPLPHNFTYGNQFDILDSSKNATMLTILRATETTGVEDIEVNPRHGAFAEETGPTIFNGSIVPRINFTLRASLSQALLLDNEFAHVQLHMLPIYTAFEDSLTASDDKTDTEVEDIIELDHSSASAKRVQPLYTTAKLSGAGTQPLNTVIDAEAYGAYGLTTDAILEYVNFQPETFFDALSYYTNGGMLRKVTGSIKTWTLTRDRNAMYHSNNFTNPTVKRGNPWMYCGVILWVTTPGQFSYGVPGDFDATDKDILHFNAQIRFDEWNPSFDQTAT